MFLLRGRATASRAERRIPAFLKGGACSARSSRVTWLRLGEVTKRSKQAIDFFHRVVVYEPDAEESAFVLDSEALSQIHRVIVAVPREDAAVA
jgi:hypothetical protein